ncbi:MAG: hypothetical protein AVDCRST_MAG37-2107 [uncultured Rubrobacteraceae bacterium]|uniref:DUF5666 domain-containing protein n=1 Tax=uncultured Rubrobacteraceae bacterium TaxID=349277 RepID=A0A6J4QLY0_9ACTN|nr:MAG: hypothetical protein AVDCRST_MAG37-2107 [uncultured Rubrobacteraceae bacterium]
MKKLILLMTVLTIALVRTVPALAQGAASGSATVSGDQSAENPTDDANSIRGTITSISGSVVLVEEDPADESGSAKGAWQAGGARVHHGRLGGGHPDHTR